MKYLLYKIEGFFKKCPLLKPEMTVGRAQNNDLIIDDEFISRKHLNIKVNLDSILIKDIGSENGFIFKDERRKKAVINIGETFTVGNIAFILQEGDYDDFTVSNFIQSYDFDHSKEFIKGKSEFIKTRSMLTIFQEVENDILNRGTRFINFNDFTSFLSLKLSGVPDFGSLFLVMPGDSLNIQLSVNGCDESILRLKKIMNEDSFSFGKSNIIDLEQQKCKKRINFLSFPIKLGNYQSSLIYIPKGKELKNTKIIKTFLGSLSIKMEILYNILEEKINKLNDKPVNDESKIDIITNSRTIQDLISQSKKIAQSDIFILIQGESGTGKELFAKLIHKHSRRSDNELIALNCAAIPANLLEAELFGYEKGAFTGAFSQKKGKLEMASGGTLVLDEIGDMPMNLQLKLLRALQEQEFYRLGGATPIKVDLRIISLTHQNLEQLIKKKKFREDLYYRLVHRILIIPPLRERREDIPSLINFFTRKFCGSIKKAINGYTIKAFEALVKFEWKGNVRQLENEIKSIISLTDDGEAINFDILSDKIKENYNNPKNNHKIHDHLIYNKKPEMQDIVEILEKNNWNKSRAASELNMTYHGLHKKMRKLGIKKPA